MAGATTPLHDAGWLRKDAWNKWLQQQFLFGPRKHSDSGNIFGMPVLTHWAGREALTSL
ncbi:hypothetical protein MES5069_110048 [Mesorhizobium escarrei]|uniref:Uncharacterized protein n=1 Tax=Mesorhizobium escarrei TaxID=666018 RepID=A0ABM9DG11_9HYPH|nr:hypothetical protein MES5069_110048 [Mesorhizobium escarrei]